MADPISIPSVGASGNATLGPAMSAEDQLKALDYLHYVKPALPNQQDPYWSNYFQQQATGGGLPPVRYNDQYQDESRALQSQLIQQLHSQAAGDMNTAAQQQLRQNVAQAQGQTMGGAAARGNFGGAGAGMRYAQQAAGSIGAQGADAAQMLKLQEQQAAQALLAQMYQQQQQQDLTQAGDMSQTALRNQALQDQYFQGMAGAGAGFDTQRLQNNMDVLRAMLGFDLESQAINKQFANQMMGVGAGITGTLFNMPWGGNNSQPAPGYAQSKVDAAFNEG